MTKTIYFRPEAYLDPDGTVVLVVPKKLTKPNLEALVSALHPSRVYLTRFGNVAIEVHAGPIKHTLNLGS